MYDSSYYDRWTKNKSVQIKKTDRIKIIFLLTLIILFYKLFYEAYFWLQTFFSILSMFK